MTGLAITPGASQADIDAALAAHDREFSEYGGGFIDYTDNDYNAGVTVSLVAGTPTQMMRDLSASAANSRLNRPFTDWAPWDNTAKLVRPHALYDTFFNSSDIRVVPDKVGGVLRVSFMAGVIELGGKNMAITAQPGVEEKIRVDFKFPVRNSFFNNGAKIMLTASVPMTLVEFSPEFYPDGYEA